MTTTLPHDTQAHGECDTGQKRVDETNTSAKHVRISDKNEHIPQSRTVQEQALIALTQEAQGRGEYDDPAKPCPRCGSVREQEPVAWRVETPQLKNILFITDPAEIARFRTFKDGRVMTPLYTTPPVTPAIRQQAMNDAYERAAKVCQNAADKYEQRGQLNGACWSLSMWLMNEIRALIGKREARTETVETVQIVQCIEEIEKHIKPGPVQGDGWDKTAERNGMILACNILSALRRKTEDAK